MQMLIENTLFNADDLTDGPDTIPGESEPSVQPAQANTASTEFSQIAETGSGILASDTVVSSVTTGGNSGAGIADFRALLVLLSFSSIRRLARKSRTRRTKVKYRRKAHYHTLD